MKILRCILGTTLLFCLIFTFLFGYKKIGDKNSIEQKAQKNIIVGWQIDCFEGGVGSRRNFLLGVAKDFEKINSDYLIMINSYSQKEANDRLLEGQTPDFISFSHGVVVHAQNSLKTEYYSPGGLIGNKTYAVPWCRGGYVLISKKDVFLDRAFSNVIVSNSENTMPILAFLEEGFSCSNFSVFTPKTAYQNFLVGSDVLLGTQRDVVRLESREETYYFKPLEKYNDLYQYISITTIDNEKTSALNDFIDLLLSEKIQSRLKNIKMFSDVVDLEFENEVLTKMQSLYDFGTTSVFTELNNITEIKEKLLSIKNINDKEYIKIKNLIVKP